MATEISLVYKAPVIVTVRLPEGDNDEGEVTSVQVDNRNIYDEVVGAFTGRMELTLRDQMVQEAIVVADSVYWPEWHIDPDSVMGLGQNPDLKAQRKSDAEARAKEQNKGKASGSK